MDLGEKLSHYRHAKGLTQCEAAEILHVSRQCLGNWEAGRREPCIAAFARIWMILISINRNSNLHIGNPSPGIDQAVLILWGDLCAYT